MNLLLQDDLEKYIITLLGRASKEIMFHVLHHSFTQKQSITGVGGFLDPKIFYYFLSKNYVDLHGDKTKVSQ